MNFGFLFGPQVPFGTPRAQSGGQGPHEVPPRPPKAPPRPPQGSPRPPKGLPELPLRAPKAVVVVVVVAVVVVVVVVVVGAGGGETEPVTPGPRMPRVTDSGCSVVVDVVVECYCFLINNYCWSPSTRPPKNPTLFNDFY